LSSQATCLANVPASTNETIFVDTVTGKQPGLSFSPDDQCKMSYGKNASFCQVNKRKFKDSLNLL